MVVTELFVVSGSGDWPVTLATSVITGFGRSEADRGTRSIVRWTVLPTGIEPICAVMTPPVSVGCVPRSEVAPTYRMPAGSGLVNTTPDASLGPMLVTVIV